MRVNDLLNSDNFQEQKSILGERCSQFIYESGGLPLLKNLPIEYNDFHKVKVRKRRKREGDDKEFAEVFNEAFEDQHHSLRERAVFANGPLSFESADSPTLDPFFIFPIDGYRFMYSREVESSNQDYKTVFDTIFEEFGDTKGNEVITELLKFTYTSDKLYEGIEQGSEIILYNLPYFYAIRASSVEEYDDLLRAIEDTE